MRKGITLLLVMLAMLVLAACGGADPRREGVALGD